jgi:ribonuclease HI
MLQMFTDGACKGNPGPGGWSVVIPSRNTELSGASEATTNNIMELRAVVEALKWAFEHARRETGLELLTDSQYIHKAMTSWIIGWQNNGWKTAAGEAVKNKELFEQILALCAPLPPLKFTHVAAHSGIRHNERADELARAQAGSRKSGSRKSGSRKSHKRKHR